MCLPSGCTFKDSTFFQAGSGVKQNFPHYCTFMPADNLHSFFLLKQLFTKGGVGAGVIMARIGNRGAGLPGISETLQILHSKCANFAQIVDGGIEISRPSCSTADKSIVNRMWT